MKLLYERTNVRFYEIRDKRDFSRYSPFRAVNQIHTVIKIALLDKRVSNKLYKYIVLSDRVKRGEKTGIEYFEIFLYSYTIRFGRATIDVFT